MTTQTQNPQATAPTAPAAPAAAVQQPEPFIDKKELARRIKRGLRTIGYWMENGNIPYYKVGTAVLFKYSEVEAHLRKNHRICRRVRFD